MKKLEPEQIRKQASQFQSAHSSWHVHYLTPQCALNTSTEYLTLLECPSENYIAAFASDNDDKSLIKELTEQLHSFKIAAPRAESSVATGGSDDAKKIIEKATQLNAAKIQWHHHVLFPDCHFNSHSGRWTLMLEDPQTQETLESLTDQEPKEDLTLLEPLFYADKGT